MRYFIKNGTILGFEITDNPDTPGKNTLKVYHVDGPPPPQEEIDKILSIITQGSERAGTPCTIRYIATPPPTPADAPRRGL